MTHLEMELNSLELELKNMWKLVCSQLLNAKKALLEFDKDLAREVIVKEKRVNSAELSIDQNCENILAIFSPVAVDLRFILAVLKINTNLERVGDIAWGISKYVINIDHAFKSELLESTQVIKMFDQSIQMIESTLHAFKNEDSALLRSIFKQDEFLDEANQKASDLIVSYIKENSEDIHQALYILSVIRKLERVGDQTKNIVEEIIFYMEAKVIKHANKR
jgi:phosphate transport system protein